MADRYSTQAEEVMPITRRTVRQAYCPECNAKPGEFCRRANGDKRSSSHIDRWQAYRELSQITAILVEKGYKPK